MPDLAPVAALLGVLVAGAATVAVVDRGVTAIGAGQPVRRALLDPLEAAARLLVQRRRRTVAPDRLLWRVGIMGPLAVAALMLVVIPLGSSALADLPIGVVWFNAMDVLLWAVFWLLGWGPNAPYPLIGGYRFLALALAYELPLMFALTGPAIRAGSLDVAQVVAAQAHVWNVVLLPAGFLVFLLAILGFSMTGPFAHPVGADLGGGVLAELSGLDRLLVLAGRDALLFAGAAMSVPLFLGGGAGPLLPAAVWSVLKTLGVVMVLVTVRHRMPHVRGDRFLGLSFVVLLPLTVVQLLVPSLLVVGSRA